MPAGPIYEVLRLLGEHPTASLLCLGLAGSIHLVERRGKREKIDPKRQLDICTLLEGVPEAAMIIDADNRIVEGNSAAAQLLGGSREQLRGASTERFSRLVEDGGDHASGPVLQRALRGQVVRNERRVVRNPQTGEVLELLASANPIRDESGEIIAALVIARDVTELRHLQQRVGDIERHRAIGQMAAALAHDFNNILGTIGQAAAVLEMNADHPAQERKVLLDMIQNTVRRGAEIISRVREYLRTGRGELRPGDVGKIMKESVELTRPLWQKANVHLTTRLDMGCQARTNDADLRRVFTNMIINAIEAMPRGGDLTLTCEKRDGRVVANVSDTGEGIPPENQKKIFFPYFTTKPQGTGLGLSGAQKILLAQGGDIRVASEPGKGTTFTVILPALDGPPRDSSGRNSKTTAMPVRSPETEAGK